MSISRRSLLSLPACTLLPTVPRSTRAAKRLTVVASFSILGDIVREVGGSSIDLHVLVGPDSDGHLYQPTPADSRLLQRADLVVINGLGFEGWIERLIAAAGYARALLVASEGIAPLLTGGGSIPQPDPHAWQDVSRVRHYVKRISAMLAVLDPDEAEAIAARTVAYDAALESLDAEIRQQISTLPPQARTVVTSHDAFRYFGNAYGLAFVAPVGIDANSQPSAADLARLLTQIRELQIRAVFIENISDPRLLGQITRQTGARIGGTLYSDALSPPNGPAASYLALQRHNLRVLMAALQQHKSLPQHRQLP